MALCCVAAVWVARSMAMHSVARLRATGPVWADRDSAGDVRVVACLGAAVVCAGAVRGEPSIVVLAWSTVFFSLVDIDTQSVPTNHARIASIAALIAVVVASRWSGLSPVDAVVGAVVAAIAMKAIGALSRGDLGAGDVALSPIVGIYAGSAAGSASGSATWFGALSALAFALTLAGLVAAVGVVTGRMRARSHLPLVPFLFAGAWIVVLR